MSPQDILSYKMAIPPAQFPLIAHLVKWVTHSDDVECSRAIMIMDGVKYRDGLLTSYMMQIHDTLMMRRVEALLGANIDYYGLKAMIVIKVTDNLATLDFFEQE
jgi:hypothetical protein